MSTLPIPVPVPWLGPLEHFETTMRAAGMRPATIATRARHIRRLARTIGAPPHAITPNALLEWAGNQDWAPETRHAYYVSIKEFYAAMGADPSPAAVLPSISRPTPPPRPTPEHVFAQALARADERTRAILTLAGCLGLRCAEITRVHRDDLADGPMGATLIVRAKGGHDRVLPLDDQLASLIRRRTQASPEGWAFPSRDGGHIHPRWASKLASQVLPLGWTLHSLRHRFATVAYQADRDILAIQRLLGHSSVATTQRYTAPALSAMRAAITAAHPATATIPEPRGRWAS
ncbi:tyrosine-type recombinase/integrase [Actinomyces oricola]|uniref:tyrosine-type recombinase/integrase n=1 Tax=Actinomyces oricola TaxID=206043 RepID=UPI000FFEE8F9|nr:tyrosine-type recombinase/integrase [Actinomyces oricola]